MKNKTISISNELDSFLDTIPNASEFIRDAIELKMGKTSQTLEQLENEIRNHYNMIDNLEKEYNELIDAQLAHQEQLKLSEIKELEEKKRQKEIEEKTFMNKWTPILCNIPNILELDTNDGLKLREFSEELVKKDIRISPSSLRRYIINTLQK